jgi:hypothetical protein
MRIKSTEIKGLKTVTLVNNVLTLGLKNKFLSERLSATIFGEITWQDGMAIVPVTTTHGAFVISATPQEYRALKGGGFYATLQSGAQIIRSTLGCKTCGN